MAIEQMCAVIDKASRDFGLDARLRDPLHKLAELLVEAVSKESNLYCVRVRRFPTSVPVLITDVGFGVSQILPVIALCYYVPRGSTVILEQPEIHLHPRAQRRLAHVLAEAANRGVIVVAETHSSLLLKEVQTIIATGKLPKEDVRLHWVQRQQDGRTIITAANLDDNGAYGDWPEDFDEVELDAEKTYLDAVESNEAKK